VGEEYFVLSDNPVSIIDPNFEEIGRSGIGVAYPTCEVTIPIGKNTCLLATWMDAPVSLSVGRNVVDEINRRSAFWGTRFFVHPKNSRKILTTLSQYQGTETGIVTENVPVNDERGRGYICFSKSKVYRDKRTKTLFRGFNKIFDEKYSQNLCDLCGEKIQELKNLLKLKTRKD